ncbi:hypothetical protein TNCV_1198161 [Trichonephila clavipes]|uniref:Uncharacterized protein n=1 Tax=Trichonephila clavipes TaxID=2585209 RepID=A0A8X6SBM2_TRICX|nr:hypothetical protein TNCV_1198161 [Trichonephila clavipes]
MSTIDASVWSGAAGWNKVDFTDESRFILSSDDNRVRVWRPRGERLNPAFALQRHTASTAGVMLADVLSGFVRTPSAKMISPRWVTSHRNSLPLEGLYFKLASIFFCSTRGTLLRCSSMEHSTMRMSSSEHDFAASKATDHDVLGDETENNSTNPHTLVVENQHINPPE